MSKTQIEKRAKRIMTKANSLGFAKNGAAMVIDQAREILAAAEGHRNWHAMLASLTQQPAGVSKATTAHVDSAAGTMLQALELVSGVLDRLAHGADFDRVVDETGVTYQVLAAIREAKTGQKDGASTAGQPTYDQLYKTLYALGSQNDIWTKQPNIDVIVNEWLQSARDVLGMELNASGDLVAKAEAEQQENGADENGLTAAQRREAEQQGWNLFDADGVELQIQREDDQMVFPGDDEAWLFVLREAKRNPESAAAKALALVEARSPAEYAKIVSFDRDNEQLLVKGPKGCAGHPVNLDEVAEWVGLHHKVNFETAGARQQEWIDRFILAHSQEGRFATYLVAHSWEHIFIGKTRSITRWVFQLGGDDEGIIQAQIRTETGRWVDLDRVAMDDLEESVYDNSVPDDYEQWAPEVQMALQLPSWAAPQEEASQTRDDTDSFTEILQHRIRWHLCDLGDLGAPTELPESTEEHIERLIREGFNQGELLVSSDNGETEFRGWWSIDKS